MRISIGLWLIAQIVAVFFYWGIPQVSDAGTYGDLATIVAANNVFYPTKDMLATTDYIFNPGYVNWLSIIYRIFGSLDYASVFNIALNCLLLAAIFRISLKLGGKKVAEWTAILFCMLSSNFLIAPLRMTELPFLCLSMISVALLTRIGLWNSILAGVIIIIANYIRPTGIIYALPCILYLILIRRKLKELIAYLGGIAIGAVLILTFNYEVSQGSVFLSSTTSGINMRLGAFDEATGSYPYAEIPDPNLVSMDNPNVFDTDKAYRKDAIQWITENPTRWLVLSAKKVFYLIVMDYWLESSLPGERSDMRISERKAELFTLSAVYYLVSILAIVGIWVKRRELWGVYGLVLIPVLGVLFLAILTVGSPRYHYPAMPSILFFAANAICTLIGKSTGYAYGVRGEGYRHKATFRQRMQATVQSDS